MSSWQQRKRSKQRGQMLRDNIIFRQNLREVNRNEQSMEKLAHQYALKAVEAEQAGNHALAVYMAAEAARIRKHLTMTGNMRGTLEMAHAVQSTNRAMSDIMEISRSAAGSVMMDASYPDAYSVQTDLCEVQDQMRSIMEESAIFYEDLENTQNTPENQEGELYLRALMSNSHKSKQQKILQDTNSRLEKLNRNRPTEHEGGRHS